MAKIIKILKGGVQLHRTSQNYSFSGVKETAKTYKDLGMTCYVTYR